jgi:hypothetical protein
VEDLELPDEIEAELLRLAFEAHRAVATGVSLATACRDAASFPALAALHAGLGDALSMSPPPELRRWLGDLRQGAAELGGMRDDLAWLAARGQPLEAALARFLLFEAVRANLLVAVWASETAYEAVGGSTEEVDAIAEAEVVGALGAGAPAGSAPSSFRLLLAAAMIELTRHAELLREALARTQEPVVASLAERAAIEARLRVLDPVDAMLVRNELARYLGEERYTLEELQRQHPVLLGGLRRDALDQRLSRFRKRLRQGGLAAIRSRKAPALAELLLGGFEE